MDLSQDIPLVNIDKEKMELAVQNLLENAAKYTPEGGSIDISLEKHEAEVVFKIKDTGVGIPETEHERIFTKFFRGENVIKMETEGSGLGLYTTRNIIDAHRGKIWFESKEGKGTTFFFSLPFAKQTLTA
jgi:signal transduction histidine kinase